jgi:hypothetical protein
MNSFDLDLGKVELAEGIEILSVTRTECFGVSALPGRLLAALYRQRRRLLALCGERRRSLRDVWPRGNPRRRDISARDPVRLREQ